MDARAESQTAPDSLGVAHQGQGRVKELLSAKSERQSINISNCGYKSKLLKDTGIHEST